MITYEINGFYSNGLPLVADPTFRVELQFHRRARLGFVAGDDDECRGARKHGSDPE